MFNRKGTTLIEALFSFFIYVTVLVMFVSLISTLNTSSLRLADKHDETRDEMKIIEINDKPESLLKDILSE